MKYLNKLFAFEERQSQPNSSSATLTSTLYSVTFIPESHQEKQSKSAPVAARHKEISIVAHGGKQASSWKNSSLLPDHHRTNRLVESATAADERFLTGPIIETKQDSPTISSIANERQVEPTTSVDDTNPRATSEDDDYDDDWILIDNSVAINQRNKYHSNVTVDEINLRQLQQMALDKSDVELVKASWVPVRKDKDAAGVLLFRGLFTKFPDYLRLFSFKDDFDLEHMHENKRLLSHAKKVIDTVSFVVDSVGDESQTQALNDALVSLVKGHLKKKPPVGLSEFRNLGIVLIDFICDINNRRGSLKSNESSHCCQLNKSSTGDSINNSSIDSETMTNALDKVRASTSPSSSSEEDSYLGVTGGANNITSDSFAALADGNESKTSKQQDVSSAKVICSTEAKIDTNLLVAAWTKLYSSILDLVKREEEQADM